MRPIIIVAIMAASFPAEARDMEQFINGHRESTSVWRVSCFQAGRNILNLQNVRIGRYRKQSKVLVDAKGRELALFPAPGTTCLMHQTAGRRVSVPLGGRRLEPQQGGRDSPRIKPAK